MKSKIKFEVQKSTDKVNFLDVTVSIMENCLKTSLYSKPTDACQYLNTSSNHPKHVISNIPKGQFIRIRRICSNKEDYWESSNKLSIELISRGYHKKKLSEVMNEVAKMDRTDLLKDKDKKEKDPQLIFVCDWHPSLSKLPTILKKHYHLINSGENNSQIFSTTPSVAFRRPKPLRNHLVTYDICPPKKKPSKTESCSAKCKFCKTLKPATSISNPKKRIAIDLKHPGNCKSRNLIYAARCIKCDVIYVGQTGDTISNRFSKHRYDIKKRPENSELAEHFFKDHNESDMEVCILETGIETEEERELQEDKWICRLQTVNPHGINKDLHQYGKDMYKTYSRIV